MVRLVHTLVNLAASYVCICLCSDSLAMTGNGTVHTGTQCHSTLTAFLLPASILLPNFQSLEVDTAEAPGADEEHEGGHDR